MGLYYLLKALEVSLGFLPKRLSYFLASVMGAVAFRVVPSLRRTISGNIRQVLGPQASNGKLNKTVRGVLSSTFKNYFDLVCLPRLSRKKIVKLVNVTGRHHLDKAVAKGKGAILFTAHLGSFDTALQIFCVYPTQVTVVVEPISPTIILDYVTRLRQMHGVNILPAKTGALRTIIKLLRKGEIVLFALDRDTTSAGINSPFFGRNANMPAEAVKIAMRTGAAIVPVFNNRRSDGGYNIYVEPEIDVKYTGTDALEHNVRAISEVMEKYIGRFPDQWVVLESIWNGS